MILLEQGVETSSVFTRILLVVLTLSIFYLRDENRGSDEQYDICRSDAHTHTHAHTFERVLEGVI